MIPQRSTPEQTKLTICVWHPFNQWRPTAAMGEAIRKRWPGMRVVHLPDYTGFPRNCRTRIFLWAIRCGRSNWWMHET